MLQLLTLLVYKDNWMFILFAGPNLVRKFRPDFQKKFSTILDDDTIFNYIYHCNAQAPR